MKPQPKWKTVSCPYCTAKPEQPCWARTIRNVGGMGQMVQMSTPKPHKARIKAAFHTDRASGGERG